MRYDKLGSELYHKELIMSLRLGDTAPDFTAETTEGFLNFHAWLGSSWGVLFSHPKDFTPVCTTELGHLAKIKGEFDKRNVKIIGISVDDLASHEKWIEDINDTQNTSVNFPIIADEQREVAMLYDMIHPKELDTLTVRSVFVIAPDKAIRLILTYPASTGRDFNELLRTIDSLQLTQKHKVATPVNWRQGDKCVVDHTLSDEEAAKLFPQEFEKVRPYLRIIEQPKIK